MSKYIATRLHKALEVAPDEPFLARCAALPHYVVDDSLVELLTRSDVEASIRAMIEAGIMHLPFAEMLIEVEMSRASRCFVYLEEYQDRFRAMMAVLHQNTGTVEVDPDWFSISMDEAGMTVDSGEKRSHESWMKAAGLCVGIALLMMNIQGIDREVIEPTRLNSRRVARGGVAIPRHTVMRIGHVYGRNGERIGYGGGRQMPVHLRAGHARRQHYGEGNELTKIVYIPPVLVNFHPGAQEPKPPKRVLAA